MAFFTHDNLATCAIVHMCHFLSVNKNFKLFACFDFEACWPVESVAVSDVSSMESELNSSRLAVKLRVALHL